MDGEIETQRTYRMHSSIQCLILLFSVLALFIICASILLFLLLSRTESVDAIKELVKAIKNENVQH